MALQWQRPRPGSLRIWKRRAYTHANTNTDTYWFTHAYAYAYAYAVRFTHPHSNSNSDSNAYPDTWQRHGDSWGYQCAFTVVCR